MAVKTTTIEEDEVQVTMQRLFGKLPDNSVRVDDLLATTHSLQINTADGALVCCNIAEPAEPEEAQNGRKLSEDVLQF